MAQDAAHRNVRRHFQPQSIESQCVCSNLTAGTGQPVCGMTFQLVPLFQIRLDKTSMPAPAVASLYITGSGAGMLSAERALYHAAVHLTWPNALTDDDEYLSCFISELLLGEHEAPVGDRHLPRHALPACIPPVLVLSTNSASKATGPFDFFNRPCHRLCQRPWMWLEGANIAATLTMRLDGHMSALTASPCPHLHMHAGTRCISQKLGGRCASAAM
jgi:hypothetical protein